MIKDSIIIVEHSEFIARFPYFQDKASCESIQFAYEGSGSFISPVVGDIDLPENIQERGVFLATAHQLYLSLNPDLASQGKLTSASEGSVSASFQTPQLDNWLKYWLSLSPYGTELLAILSQVQPQLPRKPINIYPYYNGELF